MQNIQNKDTKYILDELRATAPGESREKIQKQ